MINQCSKGHEFRAPHDQLNDGRCRQCNLQYQRASYERRRRAIELVRQFQNVDLAHLDKAQRHITSLAVMELFGLDRFKADFLMQKRPELSQMARDAMNNLSDLHRELTEEIRLWDARLRLEDAQIEYRAASR